MCETEDAAGTPLMPVLEEGISEDATKVLVTAAPLGVSTCVFLFNNAQTFRAQITPLTGK